MYLNSYVACFVTKSKNGRNFSYEVQPYPVHQDVRAPEEFFKDGSIAAGGLVAAPSYHLRKMGANVQKIANVNGPRLNSSEVLKAIKMAFGPKSQYEGWQVVAGEGGKFVTQKVAPDGSVTNYLKEDAEPKITPVDDSNDSPPEPPADQESLRPTLSMR